jgi:mitochondrial fission protein ELM1
MTPEWMRSQLEEIFAVHKKAGREIWVTTSRRTPPEAEAVVDSFPFDYKLLYSKDHFNPIPAFVSLASHLYVSAESTGMLSEACSFGKAEVHVMDNLNPGPHKFRRFAETCARLGAEKVNLEKSFTAAKSLLHIG